MKNNVVTDCFYKNRFTKKFFDFNNDINQVQKFKNRRTFRSNGDYKCVGKHYNFMEMRQIVKNRWGGCFNAF